MNAITTSIRSGVDFGEDLASNPGLSGCVREQCGVQERNERMRDDLTASVGEPAGYRALLRGLFKGPISRPRVSFPVKNSSMHSRSTEIEFSTNLQHRREKPGAGFHVHGKDLG
jgi:hypothetical protein